MKIPETFKKYSFNKILSATEFVNARETLSRNNINNLYQFMEHSPAHTASILCCNIGAWLEIMHTIYMGDYFPTPNNDGWTDKKDESSPLIWIRVSDESLKLGDTAPILIYNNIFTAYDITFINRNVLENIRDIGKVRYARIAEAMWNLGWATNIYGVWSRIERKPLFKIITAEEYNALFVDQPIDVLFV